MRDAVTGLSSWLLAIIVVWIAGQMTYDSMTQAMIASGAVIRDACVGGASTVGVAFGLAIVSVVHMGIYLAVGTIAGVGMGILLVRFMAWCPPQSRQPITKPALLTAIMFLNAIATYIGSGLLAGILTAHYQSVCIDDAAMSHSAYWRLVMPTLVWGLSLLSGNLVLPLWARAIAIRQ
ncbi:MAG: hypothetical protein AAGD09_19840 [Cyanobacteria bacterium P01_F01_bin.56]